MSKKRESLAEDRPINVAIVEDDEGIRDSLAVLIGGTSGFRCTETYPTAEDALEGIPGNRPDVVLMDINLPQMSGIECVRKLKDQAPELPVVMLTVYEDGDQLFRSLMAGAAGYLVKRTPPSKLLESIEEVHRGGSPMSRQIARKVVRYFHEVELGAHTAPPSPLGSDMEKLTAREHEILACLAKGFRYKEIAGALGISSDTVRGHLRNIYEKLQVHSRTEAVVKFLGS
jgi:DNA-binding NarL/FixJ family response regulator